MSRDNQNLSKLLIVLEAKEHAIKMKMQALRKEEEGLRAALKELDRNAAEATNCATSLKQIGVDVVRLRWIGGQRRSVNLQLSTVLVRKEAIINDYKEAFGRTQSFRSVMTKRQITLSKKMSSAEYEKGMMSALYQSRLS